MNEQKETGLKWLNIDAIHQHCRIDFNCEDAELEQYGIAAEQAILDLTRRTFENFIDTYGRIPDPIFNASLLLVQSLYKNRDAEEQRDSKEIAFGFSFMVKNYMYLAGGTPLQVERDGLLDKLTVVMTEFDFDFGITQAKTWLKPTTPSAGIWQHSTIAMPISNSRPRISVRSSVRRLSRQRPNVTRLSTRQTVRIWDIQQDS